MARNPAASGSVEEALARRKAIQGGVRRDINPDLLEDPGTRPSAGENEDVIREALSHRGTPYKWGGASRGGFDCSGFAMYVLKQTRGVNLPHSASAQATKGTPVARGDLQPGDLVFFRNGRRIGHVGIYVGNNQFIHAPNRRSHVRIDSLSGWYERRYAGARRIPVAVAAEPARPTTPANAALKATVRRRDDELLEAAQPPSETR